MNILILTGSAFGHSHTEAVADKINELIEKPEHTVDHLMLRTLDMPLFGQGKTDDVELLKRKAEDADAIIIGTPNYHTSYSGILKNALDHLSFDEFSMKPVALFCNSGGMRSTDPLTQLRMVIRGVHGMVIPNQISTTDNDFMKNEDGYYEINDDELIERISNMADMLIDQAYKCIY